VVLLIVAAVIIAGVSLVAIGGGGEMTQFIPDTRPLNADIETAADVALLRPPPALWGYDKRVTDEALNAVAQTVTERDVEIAALRQQLADMRTRGAEAHAPPGQAGASGQSGASATGRWSAWQRPVPPEPGDAAEAAGQEESAQ
jgi:hypothetical protein